MEEVTKLRQLDNSIAPINKLPPEVFIEVLWHLTDDSGNVGPILGITHVCFQWRSIALQAAKLWTTFHIHQLTIIDAFLQRSQALPISISYTHRPRDPLPDIVRSIAPHVSRIRSLRIVFHHDDEVKNLFKSLSLSTSSPLEELDMRNAGSDEERVSLQPFFRGLPLPQYLRTLRIGNIRSLPTFSRPSILVNCAFMQADPRDRTIDLCTLVAYLQNCPLLENFEMSGCPPAQPLPNPNLIAELPRLRKLFLHTQPGPITAILDHVSVPHTVSVRLEILWDTLVYDLFSSNALSLPSLTDVRRLELSCAATSLGVRIFQSLDAHIDQPVLDLRVVLPRPFMKIMRYLTGWPFDPAGVEALVITGSNTPSALLQLTVPCWHRVLASFPNLTSLRVVSTGSYDTATLLLSLCDPGDQQGPSVDDDAGVPNTPCQKLAILELCDVDGDAVITYWREGPISRKVKEYFRDVVEQRAQGGRPREVYLSSTKGWSVKDIEALEAASGGILAVNLDDCDG
ncbi:hypothetical protein BD413DRAFT_27237 [Trametes elegans]|nr:hypothetical protein BD413DRAFT_27237 [Trametes elegans]